MGPVAVSGVHCENFPGSALAEQGVVAQEVAQSQSALCAREPLGQLAAGVAAPLARDVEAARGRNGAVLVWVEGVCGLAASVRLLGLCCRVPQGSGIDSSGQFEAALDSDSQR